MKLRRKIASRDFTENMMPHTRKEVFFDVWKMHWFDLLKLGLILLIAFVPVLIMTVIDDIYAVRLTTSIGSDTSEDTLLEMYTSIISFQNTNSLIRIPLYILFATVLSGVIRIIRQYSWEEVVFFRRDLWIGITQNWKQCTGLACLLGVQVAVGQYLNGMGIISQDMALKIASGVFSGITWFICFPIYACMLVQISIYGNSFSQNLRAGIALCAKAPIKTLVVLFLLCISFLISKLPWLMCHIIGQIVGVLLLPIMLLIWFLYVSAQLDKYINPTHFPELIGRGMYREIIEKNEKGELCD